MGAGANDGLRWGQNKAIWSVDARNIWRRTRNGTGLWGAGKWEGEAMQNREVEASLKGDVGEWEATRCSKIWQKHGTKVKLANICQCASKCNKKQKALARRGVARNEPKWLTDIPRWLKRSTKRNSMVLYIYLQLPCRAC